MYPIIAAERCYRGKLLMLTEYRSSAVVVDSKVTNTAHSICSLPALMFASIKREREGQPVKYSLRLQVKRKERQ